MTPHFTLSELTHSDTAVRLGINNTPSKAVIANLKILADGLEKVRAILGHPMRINSGYRCVQLNSVIGGSKTSSHCLGYAADFVCPKFGTPLEIVKKIRASGIQVDQVIEEGAWVHISFDPKMRNQYLKATFRSGKASYNALGDD